MKTIEIIGYNRANLGKAESKKLRDQSMVPCVIYGAGKQIHFYSPMILFRDLVYTAQANFAKLNIEGIEFNAVLQDIQFHPVNEVILHADFLEFTETRAIKMNIPCNFTGSCPGVARGGSLIKKKRHLKVSALPKDMPDSIEVDISTLDFGKAIRVSDVDVKGITILDSPQASIVVVEIPRALRGKAGAGEEAS